MRIIVEMRFCQTAMKKTIENMIRPIKKLNFILLFFISVSVLLVFIDYAKATDSSELSEKAYIEMRSFLSSHQEYEQNFAVFVDFKRKSMKDRFFVVDMQRRKIIFSDRVAHGLGGNSTADTPDFSNEIGSNCSSLGFYKIAEQGKMKRNLLDCFRLDGLSTTNSNARTRGILIHRGIGAGLVPFNLPFSLPLSHDSEGCFATTGRAMKYLEYRKKVAKKPLILYAFY